MGKIKKILENNLIGGTTNTEVYPVTSTKAVYNSENKNLDEVLHDISNIINIDTIAPLASGYYTANTARSAVPTIYKALGLIITYKTSASTSITEQFTGSSILGWTEDSNWTNVGSEGGNKILEWDTDAATTRKKVPLAKRKAGLQISYKPTNSTEFVNEQYNGSLFTDAEWEKDKNWDEIAKELDIEVLRQEISANYIKSQSKNLLNVATVISGVYIDRNGFESKNASYGITGFIPFNKNIYVNNIAGAAYSNIYDRNFNLVKTIASTNNYTFEEGFAYIKISVLLSKIDSTQVEYGNESTEYEPYNPIPYITKPIYEEIEAVKNASIPSIEMEKPFEAFDLNLINGAGSGSLSSAYGYKRELYNAIDYIDRVDFVGATSINILLVNPTDYSVKQTITVDSSTAEITFNDGIYIAKLNSPINISGFIVMSNNCKFKFDESWGDTNAINSTGTDTPTLGLGYKFYGYSKVLTSQDVANEKGQSEILPISQKLFTDEITKFGISGIINSMQDAESSLGTDDYSIADCTTAFADWAMFCFDNINRTINYINKIKLLPKSTIINIAIYNFKLNKFTTVGDYTVTNGKETEISLPNIVLGKFDTLAIKGIGYKFTTTDYLHNILAIKTDDSKVVYSNIIFGFIVYGKRVPYDNFLYVHKYDGDFNTIAEAISIKNKKWMTFGNNNKLNIKVGEGLYEEQLVVEPYINIYGVNRDKCILQDNSGNYKTPPVEIVSGSEIHNMTIIATHDAMQEGVTKYSYCVHADYNGKVGDTVLVEDCKLISYCNNCYGSGLWAGQPQILRRCELIALSDLSTNYAVAVHQGVPMGGELQEFIMEDCILRGNHKGVLDLSFKDANAKIKLVNNILYSDKINDATSKPYANSDEVFSREEPISEDCISGSAVLDGISCKNNVNALNSIYQS